MDNYIKIYREGQPKLTILMPMKDCMALLPSGSFIRVHRSFIVSANRIESIGNNGIRLRGTTSNIPVGRTYRKTLTNWFSRNDGSLKETCR